MILGILLFVLVAAGVLIFANQYTKPTMSLLYTDLELSESGRIIERLQAQNIPYKIESNGRTILVPETVVDEQRVLLASEGMTGTLGYEIIDQSGGIGTTSFVQKIQRLRALEGELTRTIMSMEGIYRARVHIVLPERELFSREERQPSASVMINANQNFGQPQVRAIQSMVSGAVPGLKANQISIVDQAGNLLAAQGPDDPVAGMINALEERRIFLQNQLRRKIEAALTPVVGRSGVRAEVTVDFSMERTSERESLVDPDSQVVISSQVDERSSRSTEGTPPVSVGQNLPEAEQDAATDGSLETDDGTLEITNFEVSRTVRERTQEPGEIRRVTAAVLVDGTYESGPDGTESYVPRPPAQIATFQDLVRGAIGYDAERGDMVTVSNLPFARPDPMPEIVDEGILGVVGEDLKAIVRSVLAVAVILVILFTLVIPLFRRFMASLPEGEAEESAALANAAAGAPRLAAPGAGDGNQAALISQAAAGDANALAAIQQQDQGRGNVPGRPQGIEAEIDVAQIEGRIQESALRKVGEVVQNHPEEAAAIIRTWIYSES